MWDSAYVYPSLDSVDTESMALDDSQFLAYSMV